MAKKSPDKKVEGVMPSEAKPLEECDTFPLSDFKKFDIRVGTITKIEPHPNADKLYVMMVKVFECEPERQVVAGIRQHYEMKDLLGKKVVLITNLQPAVLRGIESEGMLLAAVNQDSVVLLSPDKDIKNSAKVM